MKKLPVLKQFEYTIPLSTLVFMGMKNFEEKSFAKHLPLVYVNIDFENGHLKLTGDWQFMMSVNKHNEPGMITKQRERAVIEMDIYPATTINLDDPYSDGLVFPLEGTIKDCDGLTDCSGLMVIDKAENGKSLFAGEWHISLYIYDMQFDVAEIKFNMPLYLTEGAPAQN